MTGSALNPVFSGASPRPLGAPSPLGSEGGRRLFSDQLSGALQGPKGAPSPRGSGGGPRLLTEEARQAAGKLDALAAFFVQQMMDAMHKTTLQEGEGFPHGGRGEQVFQGMMDQEISQKLSQSMSFRKTYAKTLQKIDRREVERIQRQAEAPVQEGSSLA